MLQKAIHNFYMDLTVYHVITYGLQLTELQFKEEVKAFISFRDLGLGLTETLQWLSLIASPMSLCTIHEKVARQDSQ